MLGISLSMLSHTGVQLLDTVLVVRTSVSVTFSTVSLVYQVVIRMDGYQGVIRMDGIVVAGITPNNLSLKDKKKEEYLAVYKLT